MRILVALSLMSAAAFASDQASQAYTLESSPAVKVKKGAQGSAHVEIVPREDAHVSPDAPLSLTMVAPEGVTLTKAKLGRTDGRETQKKGVSFDIPFTATRSGELKGKLNFFICTASLCEKQSREIATAVQVE